MSPRHLAASRLIRSVLAAGLAGSLIFDPAQAQSVDRRDAWRIPTTTSLQTALFAPAISVPALLSSRFPFSRAPAFKLPAALGLSRRYRPTHERLIEQGKFRRARLYEDWVVAFGDTWELILKPLLTPQPIDPKSPEQLWMLTVKEQFIATLGAANPAIVEDALWFVAEHLSGVWTFSDETGRWGWQVPTYENLIALSALVIDLQGKPRLWFNRVWKVFLWLIIPAAWLIIGFQHQAYNRGMRRAGTGPFAMRVVRPWDPNPVVAMDRFLEAGDWVGMDRYLKAAREDRDSAWLGAALETLRGNGSRPDKSDEHRRVILALREVDSLRDRAPIPWEQGVIKPDINETPLVCKPVFEWQFPSLGLPDLGVFSVADQKQLRKSISLAIDHSLRGAYGKAAEQLLDTSKRMIEASSTLGKKKKIEAGRQVGLIQAWASLAEPLSDLGAKRASRELLQKAHLMEAAWFRIWLDGRDDRQTLIDQLKRTDAITWMRDQLTRPSGLSSDTMEMALMILVRLYPQHAVDLLRQPLRHDSRGSFRPISGRALARAAASGQWPLIQTLVEHLNWLRRERSSDAAAQSYPLQAEEILLHGLLMADLSGLNRAELQGLETAMKLQKIDLPVDDLRWQKVEELYRALHIGAAQELEGRSLSDRRAAKKRGPSPQPPAETVSEPPAPERPIVEEQRDWELPPLSVAAKHVQNLMRQLSGRFGLDDESEGILTRLLHVGSTTAEWSRLFLQCLHNGTFRIEIQDNLQPAAFVMRFTADIVGPLAKGFMAIAEREKHGPDIPPQEAGFEDLVGLDLVRDGDRVVVVIVLSEDAYRRFRPEGISAWEGQTANGLLGWRIEKSPWRVEPVPEPKPTLTRESA